MPLESCLTCNVRFCAKTCAPKPTAISSWWAFSRRRAQPNPRQSRSRGVDGEIRDPHEHGGTSNIEHRTPNIERRTSNGSANPRSLRRSMFSLGSGVSTREFSFRGNLSTRSGRGGFHFSYLRRWGYSRPVQRWKLRRLLLRGSRSLLAAWPLFQGL